VGIILLVNGLSKGDEIDPVILGRIAESDSAYCDSCYHSAVCPSICMSSVTLVHPVKAVGRNEVPFGRDTRVVLDNIILDRGLGPTMGRGDLGVGTPRLQQCRPLLNYFV